MSRENPKAAIDALLESAVQAGQLTVYPLTVARYALLELIESPLVVVDTSRKLDTLDVIPTIYIMTQTARKLSAYNSRNLDKLRGDAFEWAEDGVTAGSIPLVVNMLAQKILDMRKVAPEVVQDSKKKVEATAPTDGSQGSSSGQ